MKNIEFRETIAMALGALKANKLRAFLTLLGVVIGVFSFVGVMTGISVLQETIESSFNVLGSNTLLIQKYPAMEHGPGTRWKYRNRKDITVEEGMYIRENARLARWVEVEVKRRAGAVIQYRNRKTEPNIGNMGGTPDMMETTSLTIADGRMFSEQELQHRKRVVVLGMSVVKILFPNADPIGKTIRVDGKELRVVGIVAERGGLFGAMADNFVVMPLTTFTDIYGKGRWVNIQAKAESRETFDAMTDEIIGLLRTLHRVPPGAENDFEIMTNESLISQVNDLTFYIRVGTGAVSAIALLAAGIGIMNIMLVSVTERTREIGIRKALGAQRRSILRQFLIESVVICELGGLIGIGLGIIGGNAIALMLDIPPVFPVLWAIVGVVSTSLVGIVFGVYPAWKASSLDPIEALRYE